MKCLNCHRACEREVCDSCWSYAFKQLPRFCEYYQLLESELMPKKGFGERVSGSKTPPIPVSLEVLLLRSGGMSKPLMTHEATMREIRQEIKISFRGEEIYKLQYSTEYLLKREEWIYSDYLDYASLVCDIIKITKRIHSALGWKSEDMPIGTCPALDEEGKSCGATLKVNPQTFDHNTIIRCKVCDASWNPSQWGLLGKVLDQ